MKKTFIVLVTLAMIATLCMPVMAEPGGFVSSPSKEQAPTLVDGKNESPECVAELLITSYADRKHLDEGVRKAFESAYTSILGAEKLNELNSAIVNIAEDAGFELSDLSVSDLFDISCSSCEGHENHGKFSVKLRPEDLEGFVCLIHYVDGKWKVVENARVAADGVTLEFEEKNFSPFAIITGDDSSDIILPTVEEEGLSPLAKTLIAAAIGAAVGAGLTAGGFCIYNHAKKKKKA